MTTEFAKVVNGFGFLVFFKAPKPIKEAPPKPDVIDANPVASRKWDALVQDLDQLGILAKSDCDLMEAYCITFAMYRKALADVNKTGQVLVVKSDDNKVEVKRNPFSVELHKYMDRLTKLMGEMGLSPSSRARVAANGQEEDDAFTEYLLNRMN